ncbi:MAG: helix-turn-helix domain-containing protein [Deltaproteobacteria bacterium]|nr:helix-turn-helix domain-containing protein [Deltaproteobacteria bacterium]
MDDSRTQTRRARGQRGRSPTNKTRRQHLINEPTGEQFPLWDAQQVAKFMNVSRSWVYQRVEAGLIPHLRLGGLVRFEPEAIKKFVRHDRISATHVIERLARARS